MTTQRPLSPAKRIAIAKDVIAQIKIGAYIPTQDTYAVIGDGKELDDAYEFGADDDCDIRKTWEDINIMPNAQNRCKVCADGAIFVSGVKLFNNITFDQADGAKQCAIRYFGQKQADLIERAFEGWDMAGFSDNYSCYDGNSPTVKFYNKYENAKDRMIAIMKNIIKNNGTFILNGAKKHAEKRKLISNK